MYYNSLKSIILSCILLWGHIAAPSILSGTLIKTPHGSTSVENVAIGSNLIGYNHKQFVDTSITDVSISVTTTIIAITTNNGDVYAAPDQLFYNPVAAQWILAKEITTNTKLLDSNNNHCTCLNIQTISVPPTDVYHISTTHPHTFFVYDQELLTHNIAPLVIGLAWLFGGGLEFVGATIGTAIFGSVIGIHIYKKQAHADARFAPSIQSGGTCGGYNPDPDDDDNERKFNTISKSEFFKKVEKDYEYWRDGIYKRKNKAKGLDKKTEYIKWDHLHDDVEAYNKMGKHLGSYDPNTLQLYKGPDLANKIYIR